MKGNCHNKFNLDGRDTNKDITILLCSHYFSILLIKNIKLLDMIWRRIAVVATGVIRTPCGPSRALPFLPYAE